MDQISLMDQYKPSEEKESKEEVPTRKIESEPSDSNKHKVSVYSVSTMNEIFNFNRNISVGDIFILKVPSPELFMVTDITNRRNKNGYVRFVYPTDPPKNNTEVVKQNPITVSNTTYSIKALPYDANSKTLVFMDSYNKYKFDLNKDCKIIHDLNGFNVQQAICQIIDHIIFKMNAHCIYTEEDLNNGVIRIYEQKRDNRNLVIIHNNGLYYFYFISDSFYNSIYSIGSNDMEILKNLVYIANNMENKDCIESIHTFEDDKIRDTCKRELQPVIDSIENMDGTGYSNDTFISRFKRYLNVINYDNIATNMMLVWLSSEDDSDNDEMFVDESDIESVFNDSEENVSNESSDIIRVTPSTLTDNSAYVLPVIRRTDNDINH